MPSGPRRPAVAPIVPGLPASYAREPASRFSSSSNTTLPRVSTSLTVNEHVYFDNIWKFQNNGIWNWKTVISGDVSEHVS